MGQGSSNASEIKVLILGLDSAGKTTMLYKLKGPTDVTVTIPTIGFMVENLKIKGLELMAIDVGGRDKIRPLMRHYYQYADAVLFVVDSADDRERLEEEAKDQLHRLLAEDSDDLKLGPVAVLANKQDLPGARDPLDVAKILLGENSKLTRQIPVFPGSTQNNEGVIEALDWLKRETEKRRLQSAVTLPVVKALPSSLLTSLKAKLKLFVS